MLGFERNLYSTSSTTKSGSSSGEKPQIYIGRVQKYSTSPTSYTEGGYHRYAHDKSRIKLRFICSKARFYTCRGLFFKRVFSKRFITNRVISGVDPTQRIQVLMLPDSSSAVAHGTTAGHFSQTLTPTQPNPRRSASCVTKP